MANERARITQSAIQLGATVEPERYRARITQSYISLSAPDAPPPPEPGVMVSYVAVIVPDARALGLRDVRPSAKWIRPRRLVTLALRGEYDP